MSEINDILKPFRITIEHYGEKVIIEKPRSDITFDEFIEMVRSAARGMGFAEETIKRYFDE